MKFYMAAMTAPMAWLSKKTFMEKIGCGYFSSKVIRQILMQMKLITILLTSVLMQAGAAGYSQQITLNERNTPVELVLRMIENQTKYVFFYESEDVQKTTVSIKLKSVSIEKALEACFKDLPLTYKIVGNNVAIKKKEIRNSPKPNDSTPKVQPERTKQRIQGKVTSENGESLPGVSIIVKDSQLGTTTNYDGNFEIDLDGKDVSLIFSFVGYISQEIKITSQSMLNIILKADIKAFEEVVVVGYGTVKKSDVTGAVSKVGEANIKATPIASLDRAMQGRVAGVQVVANSAQPGGNATIRIRGTGSVNASNDPLYVIDGFPTGSLNSINTDDIESIDILKDASATAIYGSRGANGVVLVTTKRGKAGKTTVSYDGYYGIQSVRKTISLLNAQQFAEFVNEARVNGGGKPYFDGSGPEQPLTSGLGKGTDWQDKVFSTAPIQSHQLLFSGGSTTSRYAVSFGHYDQRGIISNSGFNRSTIRMNFDSDISGRLKFGVSLQGGYTKGNNARTDVDGFGGGGVINASLSFSPTFPSYNPDGTYYKNLGALNGYGVDNPLALVNEISNENRLIRVFANTFLDFKIVEGLNFRTAFGTDLQAGKTNFYSSRNSVAGANVGGSANISNSQSINWLNENTLNYSKKLGSTHMFNALAGYTIQGIQTENVSANANSFANDFAKFNNLGGASTLVAPSSGASDWRLISYIGRVNYSYDDRILLTLTGRQDGSSRFGPNNKFGFFPSGALAWKIINEKWLKNQNQITDAKFRASYGLSGNQEIGNFRFLSNISNQTAVIGGNLVSGSYTGGIANPDLRWEKSSQLDLGVDIALFSNRLQLTADYYSKTTSDLLFNVDVPSTSGFSTALKNIGSVRNKGFELSLNSVNIDGHGFRWSSEFNITFNKNQILKLDGRKEFTAGNDATLFGSTFNQILLREGNSLGTFFGRVMDGIFQNQAEVDGSAQKTAKPGDMRYKDLNADGVINDSDRDIIGNSQPVFFGGFNNSFNYKGFELNIFLQGSFGNDILNLGTFDLINLTGGNNQSARVLDRWTASNPSNEIPRANSAAGSRILSSFHIEDGSYLRAKNIMLAYNFPTGVLSKSFISSARLYVAFQNWLTVTGYTGYDPEVNRYGSSSLSQGLDYGGYPAAKTVLVGINLKF